MAVSKSTVPTITLLGAFSSINGLNFDGKKLQNGRELKDNLFNIQVEEVQNSSRTVIRAKMFRTTSVTEQPYIVEFEVDTKARKVIKSSCRCVAGESAECKHGAALYLHINEERSEGKTDGAQVWSAPSKALLQKYTKGRTTLEILSQKRKNPFTNSDEISAESDNYVQKEGNDPKCQKNADEMKMFGVTQACLFKSLIADVSSNEEQNERDFVQEEEVIPHQIHEIFYNGGFARPYTEDPPPLIDDKTSLYYQQHILRSNDEKFEIYNTTKGQSTNKNWHEARKHLVTATNARKIAYAMTQENACV